MKVKSKACDPGMKGCVLYGRHGFSDPEKNSPAIKRRMKTDKAAYGEKSEDSN